jgi:hypothetical protein
LEGGIFMSEQKYLVHGWRDSKYFTAKELHERVMEDRKSNHNWIAPARELVRICKEAGFPTDYAIDIKISILNYFANIENSDNCGVDCIELPADKEAAQYCYNSLYIIDNEEAISARKHYLTEIIKKDCYIHSIFNSLYHPGPTYRKICEDWRKSKVEEYSSQEKIDFEQLEDTLRNGFIEVIETAEKNGEFEEDEKNDKGSWKYFYPKMMKDI